MSTITLSDADWEFVLNCIGATEQDYCSNETQSERYFRVSDCIQEQMRAAPNEHL